EKLKQWFVRDFKFKLDLQILMFCVSQDQADLQAVCSGRRRTCALLNSPSPCVNSALYHIQELKMTVENWCQQSGKYHPQIDQDKHHYRKTLRFQSRDSDTESVTYTELFVEGIAISAREHEACIRDITELNWQLKLEREKLDQALEELSHTEMLNQHLHEDISFAKKQVPIVKENLDLQRDIIIQINVAQSEAYDVCSKTQSDLLLVQKELTKIKADANKEKISLDHALVVMKNELTKKLEDLSQLKILENDIRAEIKDAEQTLALTEEKCEAITQRIPEMVELEKTEKDWILKLKCQIEAEMQKNKKLKEKLRALQEETEKTRLNGEAEVSCVEEQLNSKRNAFAALRKENMEYEQNVEAYKIKLSQRCVYNVPSCVLFTSEKAVKQMCEERKQMLQKISDNDEQWEKAKEEVTQVVTQHIVTQTKLEEQEQLTFMEEQRARKEIENLRKDLTGQMTTQELLKGQCANINEELRRHQRSSELTNQKLEKEFKDASSATKALEKKVEEIKKLTEDLETIQREHRNTIVNLEEEKKLKCGHLKAAQDLNAATIKRYEDTVGRISDLTKKSEEHSDASDKMEKIIESMPEVIVELQSVFDAVEFKNKSAALIMSTLQSDINNCQQRTQRSMQTHTAHVTARKKEMEDTKEALKIALKENKQLADEYEGLKKILMEAKQEAASAMSKKNHAHKSFHDYTQLSLLQKRMHKALVKYFKQRSLYSQAELDRCQALSQETNQKIKTAQPGATMQTMGPFHVDSPQRSLLIVDVKPSRCITLGRLRNSSPLSHQPPNLLHGTVASCGPYTSLGLHYSPGPTSPDSPSGESPYHLHVSSHLNCTTGILLSFEKCHTHTHTNTLLCSL
ncbi:hypothetical protein L3Q82_021424, partial [Scortum barcoo]